MPVVGAGLGMYPGYGAMASGERSEHVPPLPEFMLTAQVAYYSYSPFSRYGYGAYTRPWSHSWYGAGFGGVYPYAGYAGYGY